MRRSLSMWWLAAAAAVPAAIAALAIVGRPQYDPYGWLLWGRALLHGSGFSTADYPSWKPLGALLALPAALAGTAAPSVWLVIERLLSLPGLVFAYLLARRLGGRAAGALAVAGMVLVTGWVSETLDGHLEPVVATLLLAACWFDVEDRPRAAFAALAVAGLARPDAWLAVGIYAVVLVRRRRLPLWTAAAVLAATPLLWFGGDYLGSGSVFRGGDLAREAASAVAAGKHAVPGFFALQLGVSAPLAVLTVAAVAALVAALRSRARLPATIGLLALSWLAVDVALAATGYPADPRFVMPEGVLMSVLGAGALVPWLRGQSRRPAALGLTAAAAAAFVLSALPAVASVRRDIGEARYYSSNVAALARVTADLRAGGLIDCHPAVSQRYQAPLAFYSGKSIAAIAHPVLDGLALAQRKVPWPRLTRLEQRAADYGGLVRRRVAGAGLWRPLVLEPKGPLMDAVADQQLHRCQIPS